MNKTTHQKLQKADQNLTSVSRMLSMYSKLQCKSKIATLAVKLAKEFSEKKKCLLLIRVLGKD